MTACLCRPRTESFQELVFLGGERRPHFELLRCRQHALKAARVEGDKGFEVAGHGGGHVQGVQRPELFPARTEVADQSCGTLRNEISLQF